MCSSTLWQDAVSSEASSENIPEHFASTQLKAGDAEEYFSQIHDYYCENGCERMRPLMLLVDDLIQGKVDTKSLNKTTELKDQGNELFKQNRLKPCLQLYRQALFYAPADSIMTCTLWSNMANAYQKLGQPAYCKWACEMGMAVGTEKHATSAMYKKLSKRYNDVKNVQIDRKLQGCLGPAGEKGLDNLKVEQDEVHGRFILSKRDFKPGEVIMREDTQSLVILPDFRGDFCSECGLEEPLFRQICQNCNAFATCEARIPDWHREECPFMFLLDSMGAAHLAFRAIMQGSHTNELANLCSNFDLFPTNALVFDYALTGWFMAWIMSKIRPGIDTKSVGFQAFEMLLKIQMNAQALVTMSDLMLPAQENTSVVQEFKQVRYGCSLFAHTSLFNHSCKPNITLEFIGKTIMVRCWREIRAGDEIRNCYGPQASHELCTETRQALLREQYYFDCDCSTCMKNPNAVASKQLPPANFLTRPLDEIVKRYDFRAVLDRVDQVSRQLVDEGDLAEAKQAVWLSSQLIARRYGTDSLQYAWELVKLHSLVLMAIDDRGDAPRVITQIKDIFSLHFCQEKVSKMLSQWCLM